MGRLGQTAILNDKKKYGLSMKFSMLCYDLLFLTIIRTIFIKILSKDASLSI